MADYAHILLAREGAIARLTLNRPGRRNALTHAMIFGPMPQRSQQ